jgi:hypothetical protein
MKRKLTADMAYLFQSNCIGNFFQTMAYIQLENPFARGKPRPEKKQAKLRNPAEQL